MQQLLFAQAAFEESASVDTWGRMTLNVEQIATVIFGWRMPEVVKADSEHVGQ